MPFLTVLGHSNIDVQLDVAAMPGGSRSSPVKSRRTVYGGTANNIARHAAGLSVPTRLWSRVGADFPPEWKAELVDAGLELAFDEHGLTPTCFILTSPDGEQAYCMDQAAMSPPYAVPLSVLDGATWLHISTGDPAAYLPVAKEARRLGIKVAFDPGQEIHFAYDARHFEQVLDEADLFFCNDVELKVALGFLGYGGPEQLLDHVDHVIVTHGANGSTLWGEKKPIQVAALAADVVDPTGAGDALRSGFYAGLHDGLAMADALALGSRVASVAVAMQGPQARTITRADLA